MSSGSENVSNIQSVGSPKGITPSELAMLHHVNRAILSSTVDLDETLQVVLDSGLELIGAQYGNLLLVEGNEVVIRATTTRPREKELGTPIPIEGSISGIPVTTKAPVRVPDVRLRPDYKAVLGTQDREMVSELAVPLMVDEKVIGVLNVESPRPDAFSEHDQELLETLAGQAAIAIRNAQHVREFDILREVDKTILGSRSLYEMLNAILAPAVETSRADYGSILLVEGNNLVVEASTKTAEVKSKLDIKNSISGLSVLRQEAVLVSDLKKYPQHSPPPTEKAMRSCLVVPIFESGYLIGTLKVESCRLDAFDGRHSSFLEMLAGLAAIAINKAETQKQLVQAENIRAIGMATSQLTHWIDNKALPIRQAIERVIQDTESQDEMLLEDLEMIQRNIMDILRIRRSLLGPTIDFQLVPTGIGDLVKDTVKLLRIPDSVGTDISIPRNLPLVRVDRDQFSQVLGNLINNALDAMRKVDRESRLAINVYFAPEDKAAKIEISDNGCGISAEHLEKIWLPFYTTKADGTGIGLSASAQIIRKMHGTIHVETEVGVGSTFTIELPAMA
jgi:signal transduction histidine kinase